MLRNIINIFNLSVLNLKRLKWLLVSWTIVLLIFMLINIVIYSSLENKWPGAAGAVLNIIYIASLISLNSLTFINNINLKSSTMFINNNSNNKFNFYISNLSIMILISLIWAMIVMILYEIGLNTVWIYSGSDPNVITSIFHPLIFSEIIYQTLVITMIIWSMFFMFRNTLSSKGFINLTIILIVVNIVYSGCIIRAFANSAAFGDSIYLMNSDTFHYFLQIWNPLFCPGAILNMTLFFINQTERMPVDTLWQQGATWHWLSCYIIPYIWIIVFASIGLLLRKGEY